MIRRFNYTGRRRIPHSKVKIRVAENGGGRSFDAELDLDDLELPAEALLFVEAYHRSTYRRYEFGTVGQRQVPSDRRLLGIPVQTPLFRVKVVVREDGVGRIVAAADQIVPRQSEKDDEARQSLLPVEYEDLGDRVWALDLDSEWPRLRLNSRIEGIRDAARSGSEFLTLVYPEVLRAILSKALLSGDADPDCDDDAWGTLWLRFACRNLGRPRPPDESGGEVAEWIDEAVNAFCARERVASAFGRMLGAREG